MNRMSLVGGLDCYIPELAHWSLLIHLVVQIHETAQHDDPFDLTLVCHAPQQDEFNVDDLPYDPWTDSEFG